MEMNFIWRQIYWKFDLGLIFLSSIDNCSNYRWKANPKNLMNQNSSKQEHKWLTKNTYMQQGIHLHGNAARQTPIKCQNLKMKRHDKICKDGMLLNGKNQIVINWHKSEPLVMLCIYYAEKFTKEIYDLPWQIWPLFNKCQL